MKSFTLTKILFPGILIIGLLCGCSDKKVNYNLDSEKTDTEKNTGDSGSLSQFKDAEKWTEQWEFETEEGKKYTLKINADITIPNVDTMSVAEAEKVVLNAEYKEKFLKSFFHEGDIYYYDREHLTKSALENKIENTEEWINSFKQLQEEGKASEETFEGLEEYEEQRRQLQQLMETASDSYTVAEDFESCNEYLGYQDKIPCIVNFYQEEDGTYIDISPHKDSFYGPEVLQDKDKCVNDAYGNDEYFERGYTISDTITNQCTVSAKEAQAIAEQFLVQIGYANYVLTAAKDISWTGYDAVNDDETSDLWTNEETVTYGYCFYYSTGMDGVAFENSGTIRMVITDAGIVEASITSPMTITKVTKGVNLLPLSTVQDIMEDEVMEHPDAYHFHKNGMATFMELIYFSVKDKSKENICSYVPVWKLSGEIESNTYGNYDPILINAIDGSVIYWEEEL